MDQLAIRGETGAPLSMGRRAFTHGMLATDCHAKATHAALAGRIAAFLDLPFAGECESKEFRPPCYLIPRATLSGREVARKYAIRSEEDLFGGWVPRGWMATKAIMHPLLPNPDFRPPDWLERLSEEACPLTLRGFTAFSVEDARAAGRLLLKRGSVRLKPAGADGGRGQTAVHGVEELDDALSGLCVDGRLADILTLEENLEEPVTYSVGQVRLSGHTISYCGTQELTRNNEGMQSYGGTRIMAVRGGYDCLVARALPSDLWMAVSRAAAFDSLADRFIPGLIATRRNYDVIRGTGADGVGRIGVLEQSWRMGGATGAEMAALEVLAGEPHVTAVYARTVETYGERQRIPESATVVYSGMDPLVGRMTKYAYVEETVED